MVRKRKRKEEPFSDILHLKRTETVLYDSQASSSNNIKKKKKRAYSTLEVTMRL